jgi:predicted phage terminase large subunit-like protein
MLADKLTPDLRKHVQQRARRELARRKYLPYVKYTHQDIDFKKARYHDLLCDKLEKVERGDIKRLMVFMPPRHGKSMTITETFPSWCLGRNPNWRVIEVSYGDDLATDFGQANKDKVELHGKELFNIRIAKNTKAKGKWNLQESRGGMLSGGILSGITGKGANLMIIDDPIKNDEQAYSANYREKLWREWNSTLKTRLTADGRVIVILTRWHEDDLAGRLLKEEGRVEAGGKWHVIELPVAAREGDALGRKPGEALCPERGFDEEWIESEAKTNKRVFAALYQQSPQIEGGNIFKRQHIQYFTQTRSTFILECFNGRIKRVPKDKCIWFQTCDTAMKDNEQNDYTVISTWALTPENDLLLIEVTRDKLVIPKQWSFIKVMKKIYPKVKVQAVEDKASGTGLIQTAKLEGTPLIPLKADKGKVARTFDISTMYENYMVFHLKDAEWLSDFEKELLAFPNASHDDQVDTASYAGILVNTKKFKSAADDDGGVWS